MKTFPHVEDYIEVLGGYRDPTTGKDIGHTSLWFTFTPIINLARYDVNVLDSMCTAAIEGKALTTRQAELASKLILKYARQLAQHGIDVTPVETPQWRVPLRVMDYGRRLTIQDDKIILVFPFNDKLIDGLREFRKNSQGSGLWSKEHKRWEYALTEYNLVYLKTWAEQNDFEIDPEANRLDKIVAETQQTGYVIELAFVDDELTIRNGSLALFTYIKEHCGGFGAENLPRLIDLAPILGYDINPGILTAWSNEHGDAVAQFSSNKELRVDTTKHDTAEVVASIVKYAENTQRFPVVIFEPDLKNNLKHHFVDAVGTENIVFHRTLHSFVKAVGAVKYIHTNVPLKNINIPLLISTAGMMFGGDKGMMLQNTEKAIYFTAEVYTDKKNYKVPEFGSETNNTR